MRLARLMKLDTLPPFFYYEVLILTIILISSSALYNIKIFVSKLIFLHYTTNLASEITFSEVSSHKSTGTTSGNYSSKGDLEMSLKDKSDLLGMHSCFRWLNLTFYIYICRQCQINNI